MNSLIQLVTAVIKTEEFPKQTNKQTFWESLNLLVVLPRLLGSSSSSLSEPISPSSKLELDLPTTALNFLSFSLLDFSENSKFSPTPFRPSSNYKHIHKKYIYVIFVYK